MKVMVVDDDDAVRRSLKKVLEDVGYEVSLATDGLEALERFEHDPVDLLLLDIGLPGQSGWEIFERVTRQNPTLPIIVITGHTGQYRMALAAGVGALMEKPLDVPRLLQTMKEVLAEPEENRLRRMAGYSREVRHVPAQGEGIP